jgi:Zn finger protein HypA/HybF involved in hydrogenase expression
MTTATKANEIETMEVEMFECSGCMAEVTEDALTLDGSDWLCPKCLAKARRREQREAKAEALRQAKDDAASEAEWVAEAARWEDWEG